MLNKIGAVLDVLLGIILLAGAAFGFVLLVQKAKEINWQQKWQQVYERSSTWIKSLPARLTPVKVAL